ncbi:MAG TPA: PAS domain-containing protein, partial [Candidatus Acidoferrum sp.]|nr:PAS domain-containing protein [Candidatus Acidoferrum sp.]
PYITFYPVIIFAALLGGTGAGLLATLLAAVLVCFIFLPPVGTFVVGRPVDIASLTLFVAINLVMSVVGGALRLSRNRSHQQSRVLARTVDMLDLTTVMVLDPEYRIIRWNSGCRRLYGYTSEQALGKVAHVLLQTRFPVPLEEIRGELARTGRWQGELRQVASDGREIIVAGEWQARGAAAGQPSAIIETNTDITDRKRAEEKLQQSEEYLRLAAIAARMGVWSWKPGTSEVVVSESWRTLFGLPPGTPTTFETWRNMVHPDDRDGVVAKLEEAWHQGHEFNAEYRIVCPDGSVRWLVDRGRGWYNPAGEATSIAGINVDITERKQAEQVLARSAADLERLVRERTAKLHEMVAELEHFSYTITHDMRAPLRAMRGLAELLVEECGASLTGERGAYLRQIASSAERMDALITDALQYSLIVRGKFELEPVDADALLRGILESYPQFHPPNAQVRVANRLPVVLANKAGLTQCFSNLLGNAVKFVRPGQVPEVVVRAEPGGNGAARVQPPAPEHAASSPLSAWHLPPGEAPAPAPTVRICIEDKGIGIEREYQDKIWLMFQRLDKSYAGTGIGLALVRKAVERMGGRVGVESERGHGSRFWVELQQANGQER